MPLVKLTPGEKESLKRAYSDMVKSLGYKTDLSLFGIESLALRWKEKYGQLQVGDFWDFIDPRLTFEEHLAKEQLKTFEEVFPEREFIDEPKEPEPIEVLEEEILTIQDKIKNLECSIREKIVVAEARGLPPEDISLYTRDLQNVIERQDMQRVELTRINRKLDELIRVGKPVKKEVPPIIIREEPSEIERIAGAAPELGLGYGLFPEVMRERRVLYCKRCGKSFPPYTAVEKKRIDDALHDIEFQMQKTLHSQVFFQAYDTCPECLQYLYEIIFSKR